MQIWETIGNYNQQNVKIRIKEYTLVSDGRGPNKGFHG